MATAFVILVSLLVGAATYVATVRVDRRTPAAIGFEGSHAALAAEAVPDLDLGDADAIPARDDEIGEAEVVDLDAARAATEPEAATDADGDAADDPGSPEASPDDEPADAAVAATTAAAMGQLAPVIVTASDVPAPEHGYAYLRVATGGPGWRDRIAGVVGIAILLVVGAAAIAFGVYQLGSAVNAVVQRFLEG